MLTALLRTNRPPVSVLGLAQEPGSSPSELDAVLAKDTGQAHRAEPAEAAAPMGVSVLIQPGRLALLRTRTDSGSRARVLHNKWAMPLGRRLGFASIPLFAVVDGWVL